MLAGHRSKLWVAEVNVYHDRLDKAMQDNGRPSHWAVVLGTLPCFIPEIIVVFLKQVATLEWGRERLKMPANISAS